MAGHEPPGGHLDPVGWLSAVSADAQELRSGGSVL